MKNTTKDKWSALSMQQRADLIKLYVDNGITNIGNIRKHYNSFATGGPVEEGKDFLKEWYSSPTTQNMVEQVAPNNNVDINQTIENIKEFEADSNIPDEGLPALVKGINYFNLDKYVDRDVYRTNRKQALSDAFTGSSIGAFYSRPHNTIVYQYGYYNPTNQVHEIDHGVQNAIPEISTPIQPVEHVLKKGVKADPYLDSKDENRSRIMELRMQQNLSPEKRDYTPKEAQKLVNTLKDSKLKGDLDRLTPETLAGYLNYLADADTFNNIPSYENGSANYAKNGGKLNKFATGGPTEEGGYSKVSNLYRKWRHHKLDPAGGLGLDQLLYLNNKSRGEEDQYWKAYLGLKNDIPKMLPSSKTEWDDKVEADKAAKGELPSDFYGTTDNMDLYIQAMADTTTTGQIVRNYEAFKKANPNLAPKENIEAVYNSGKAMMDNPNKWTQVGEVKGSAQLDIEKGLNNGEEYPLGMLASFGAKWIPEENTIHVHDTYDFPLWSRILGRVPNRPKEMKIRGKVKYNPKNRAKLFNSENFDLNFPK